MLEKLSFINKRQTDIDNVNVLLYEIRL